MNNGSSCVNPNVIEPPPNSLESLLNYGCDKIGVFTLGLTMSREQSVLKQSYTEKTNGQNNDDKGMKPTLGSHSISINYCNILMYFRVTNNIFKAPLIVLSKSKSNISEVGMSEFQKGYH